MAKKVGKDCCVKLGSAVIVGVGTWKLDGVSLDQLESTQMTDEWKTYLYGLKDGGTLTFNGLYDPADTTGQEALQQANLYGSALTNLFFFNDDTSYWGPCQTTGYFSPTLTTGAPTQLSSVCVTQFSIDADKSGLMNISFTGKVSGCMVLV